SATGRHTRCFPGCAAQARSAGSAACRQTSADPCATIAPSRPRRRNIHPNTTPAIPFARSTYAMTAPVKGIRAGAIEGKWSAPKTNAASTLAGQKASAPRRVAPRGWRRAGTARPAGCRRRTGRRAAPRADSRRRDPEDRVFANDARDARAGELGSEQRGEQLGRTSDRLVFSSAQRETDLARVLCDQAIHRLFQVDPDRLLALALAHHGGFLASGEFRQLQSSVRRVLGELDAVRDSPDGAG